MPDSKPNILVFASPMIVTRFLATFQDFRPRQRAAAFSIDHAVEKLQAFLGAD